MKKILVAVPMLLSAALASARPAASTPPESIESWGVCPFECCTYREWTAQANVPVHAQRSDRSAVLFEVRAGEAVDGLTGVVATAHPAPVTIDHALRDGYVDGKGEPQLLLASGDVIYLLAPLGEGAYRYWYGGKVYDSGPGTLPQADGRNMSLTWWKQVRNKAGQSGWTRSNAFGNVDACG